MWAPRCVVIVMRLTRTGQPSLMSQVGLASNGVSPGQTGMAAEIVGLMSQRVGTGILGFLKVAVRGV